MSRGQCCGLCSWIGGPWAELLDWRAMRWRLSTTASSLRSWKGRCRASMRISQRTTAKDQTSLLVVYFPCRLEEKEIPFQDPAPPEEEERKKATNLNGGFPGHPADGEAEPSVLGLEVVEAVDFAVGAKVADFDFEAFADEAIAGGQVAVHEIERLEVAHSGRDLPGHVDQTAHGERVVVLWLRLLLLLLERHEGGHVAGRLYRPRPEAMEFEELAQVAVVEKFEDEAERLLGGADGQDAAQVGVVQGGQEPHLLVETRPVLVGRAGQILGGHEFLLLWPVAAAGASADSGGAVVGQAVRLGFVDGAKGAVGDALDQMEFVVGQFRNGEHLGARPECG